MILATTYNATTWLVQSLIRAVTTDIVNSLIFAVITAALMVLLAFICGRLWNKEWKPFEEKISKLVISGLIAVGVCGVIASNSITASGDMRSALAALQAKEIDKKVDEARALYLKKLEVELKKMQEPKEEKSEAAPKTGSSMIADAIKTQQDMHDEQAAMESGNEIVDLIEYYMTYVDPSAGLKKRLDAVKAMDERDLRASMKSYTAGASAAVSLILIALMSIVGYTSWAALAGIKKVPAYSSLVQRKK